MSIMGEDGSILWDETGLPILLESTNVITPVVPSNGTFWNQATVSAPRNGTTGHTVGADGTGGTLSSGALFTPTAGRLLVCVVAGSVTSSTPAGWTLNGGASSINNTGLYMFWKIATGSDQIVTTHNGSNYPVAFDFYEFKAGSSVVAAVSTGSVTNGSTPTDSLTGLTGSNWIGCALCSNNTSATTEVTTWASGTKVSDLWVAGGATDGYEYSLADFINDTSTTKTIPAATISNISTNSQQRVSFAVSVAA